MKKKLLTIFLSIIAVVSTFVGAVMLTSADAAPVYSQNLAINGDFETEEAVGATVEYATAYGLTHYFGNFFSGFNFGAGTFHTNQRAAANSTVTLEKGKGVNGSNAIKIVYNGINNGFAYRVINYQAQTSLIENGKTYAVSAQYLLPFATTGSGTAWGGTFALVLFGRNEENQWVSKEFYLGAEKWVHEANVWETMSATFTYSATTADGVTKATVTDRDGIKEMNFLEIAYVDVLFYSNAAGVANEAYYDNFAIQQVYTAKVEVVDGNQNKVEGLEEKFTVNGVAVAPVYEDGYYVFNDLTGESKVVLNDTELGLISNEVTFTGDQSVLTALTGHGFWASYAANNEGKTATFRTPNNAGSAYSYELAINGNFETKEQIGMTSAMSTAWNAVNGFGNFFYGPTGRAHLAAGLYNNNQRLYGDHFTATLEEGKGVNGSNAVKVTYVPGIDNGFAYRVANTQLNTILAKAGKEYFVTTQYTVDVDKNPCGPQFRLGFFSEIGEKIETPNITALTWARKANVWETMSAYFTYDVVEADGSKTLVIKYRDAAATEYTEMSKPISANIAYIDVIFACNVGGEVTNEVYYDNFSIKEAYTAKVQVTDKNANPVEGLAGSFTVNGETFAPVYDNGLYVFNGLTGESKIVIDNETLGLTVKEATFTGDQSVWTEKSAMEWWIGYSENQADRSVVFGTPRTQDITLTLKDTAGNAVNGATVIAGDYVVEAGDNGTYVIKEVLQTAPEFEVKVKAAGFYPTTIKMDGANAAVEYTLTAPIQKSENIIVNGDVEVDDNFIAFNESATDAEVEEKWRGMGEDGVLTVGDQAYTGVKALYLNLQTSGGKSGVSYRVPANAIESGVWYTYSSKVKALNPSVNSDAVYLGFVPVLKMEDGSVKTWLPSADFGLFHSTCVMAESYPLVTWQNLAGLVKVDFNSEKGVFSFTVNNKVEELKGVEEVIGYDLTYVFSSGDQSTDYTVIIDSAFLGEAVGYTGIDLGNDSTNIYPNGDFENAASIKDRYVTFGFWTTSSQNGHVEQNTEYAKNGMASMKATFNTSTFVTVRTICYAGSYIGDLSMDNFSAVKPGVLHTVKGYVKSENVGATLTLNFMPTLFFGGTYTTPGATGSHYTAPMATYTFTENDTLDGEWVEISATFYYTLDLTTGTLKAWFNTTDFTGEPDFAIEEIYEFHALDFTLSTDTDCVAYFDCWTMYAPYDATITVADEDGNAVTDKTLVLKDYMGNDITSQVQIEVNNETNAYALKGVYGPVRVTVAGDEAYAEQVVDANHTSRTIQKPYVHTVTIKNEAGATFGENDVQISVKQEGNDVGEVTWNDDGTITISGLTGINIDVVVLAEGYKNGNYTINGAGTGEIVLKEDVKPAFNAVVTVKDSENNPINDAKVEIVRNGQVVATATSGRNGTYTLAGLNDNEAGDLKVVVTRDGYTFETDKVVTRGASTVQVVGTATGEETPTDSDTTTQVGGCFGGIVSANVLFGTIILAGFVAIKRKKN